MAAQNVSGTVQVNAGFQQTDTTGLVTPINAAGAIAYLVQMQNGTGATQTVDTLLAATFSLASTTLHINLHAATDILGNSVALARVRYWGVYVTTLTAGFIVNIYTRTGTDPVTWLPITTTGALWCPPGGIVMATDPNSTSTNGFVVSSSAFDFTIDSASNTVVGGYVIAGNSAA